MGCRKSRTIYSTASAENQELIKFENSLNAYKVSFQEMEAVCRRSTTASLSKLLCLLNSTFSLSIPTDFLQNSNVSHSEFLCFFILLGKGTPKDKNSALWYLFDSLIENNLNKDSFTRLLRNVIKAAVQVSLPYYTSKNPSTLISSWNQQLSERIEGLEQKLQKHFLGESDAISFEVFLAKCEEMPLGKICEASAIRAQLEHTQVIPKRFANPFKTMKVTKLTT